jgi:glycosyltransferase involved in cell wall biosynthesis
MSRPSITLQLCTYNRAHLLKRVLRGCFEQSTSEYEVVLVNDGSTDDTEAVIEEARALAPIRFKAINQTNRGLARSRNVGIEMASGQRIIFIDDDVLPMPNFIEEHQRAAHAHPLDVVRGAVIMTESFEHLPAPYWSPFRDYSGNFFWTSNVSVPVDTLRKVGAFNENFNEYGWEDIDLGLRLRNEGLRSHLNTQAVAFHFKGPIVAGKVFGMVNQARAQARMAIELARLHKTWRVPLATGDEPLQRTWDRLRRLIMPVKHSLEWFQHLPADKVLSPAEINIAKRLASFAYFDELQQAHSFERVP